MVKKVIVEISARHVHVTEQDLKTLFGEGHALHSKKDLSQPGQFACEERVNVVGPRDELLGVTIIGPERKISQVEISLTDARKIGVVAPVRESGHVEGSAPIKLVGPKGVVELNEGCIVAKRHVHLDPHTAEKFGVTDGQTIKVACGANNRRLVFDDVMARVSEQYAAAMHIDADEANAAGLPTHGELLLD